MAKKHYVRSGGQWVENSGGMQIISQSTSPSSPETGQIYYDSTYGSLSVYDGNGVWKNQSDQYISFSGKKSSSELQLPSGPHLVKNSGNSAIMVKTSSGTSVLFPGSGLYFSSLSDIQSIGRNYGDLQDKFSVGGTIGGAESLGIAYGNNTFVAALGSSQLAVFNSEFDVTLATIGTTGQTPIGIHCLNGVWVYTTASTIWRSSNLTTWSSFSISAIQSFNGYTRGAYGNSVYILVGKTNNTYSYYTSSDATTWTKRTGPGGGAADVTGITFYDGYFYMVSVLSAGGTDSIYRSADGINWTTLSTQFSQGDPVCVAAGNGKIVVATASAVYYSSDGGYNWSIALSGIQPQSLAFGDGYFVMNDSNNYTFFSSDGYNWTLGYAISRDASQADHIVYGDKMFVFSGTSTANMLGNKSIISLIPVYQVSA
jgi:hypothetical protein